MKLETFFDKFDLFAGAPDAVAKLRELVLQLAVTGRLVGSKPGDGDARRIFDEVPAIGESRFEVPENWIWIRFASVGSQRLGKMLDQRGNKGILKPYLRNTNVQWMRFELNDIKSLRLEDVELAEYRLVPGDLLICEGGEPGRCAIWQDAEREMYFQKAIHRVRPRNGILAEYLAICLQLDARNGVLDTYFTGATIKHLTGRSLSEYSVPLPPLPEQKRIVAKVDELMALFDRLALQQQDRESHERDLARAALARFAEAPTPANLDLLFHQSFAVPPADLRKSILTLAVQGKLVPQDPNDEPAIANLDEIDSEKAALIDARKLRPNRVTEIPQTKALQFEAPDSWRWFRLGDVAFFQEGPGIRNWQFRPEGIKLLNVQNIVDGKLVLENTDRHISTGEFESTYRHFAVETGDILFASSGASWGKTTWFVDPGYTVMLNTSMVRLKFYSKRCADAFLLLFLRSEFFKTQMEIQLVGIQPNFGSTHLGRVYIPIPPLPEQKRIVAKVDELMALVDQLEAQQAAARATAKKLLEAAVAELTVT